MHDWYYSESGHRHIVIAHILKVTIKTNGIDATHNTNYMYIRIHNFAHAHA